MRTGEHLTRIERRLLSTCAYGALSSIAAALLLFPDSAPAQQTVVIDGSYRPQGTLVIAAGQPPRWSATAAQRQGPAAVVVDLSVLEDPARGRQLRVPNNPGPRQQRQAGFRQPREPEYRSGASQAPVRLRPPSGASQLAEAPVRLRPPGTATQTVVLRPPPSRQPAAVQLAQAPPRSAAGPVAQRPAWNPAQPQQTATVVITPTPWRQPGQADTATLNAAEVGRLSQGTVAVTRTAPTDTASLNAAEAGRVAQATVAITRTAPTDTASLNAAEVQRLSNASGAVAQAAPANSGLVSLVPSPVPASGSIPTVADQPGPAAPTPPARSPSRIFWSSPPVAPTPTPPPPQTVGEVLPPAGRVTANVAQTRSEAVTEVAGTPPPPRPQIHWTTPPETVLPDAPRRAPDYPTVPTPRPAASAPSTPGRSDAREERVTSEPAGSTAGGQMAAPGYGLTPPPPRPAATVPSEQIASLTVDAPWDSARARRTGAVPSETSLNEITWTRPAGAGQPVPPPRPTTEVAVRQPPQPSPGFSAEMPLTPPPPRPVGGEYAVPAVPTSPPVQGPTPEIGSFADTLGPSFDGASAMMAAEDIASPPPPPPPVASRRDVGSDLLAYARPQGGEPDPRSSRPQRSSSQRPSALRTPAASTLPLPRLASADPRPGAVSIPPLAAGVPAGPESVRTEQARTELAALPPLTRADLSLAFEPGRTDLNEGQTAQLASLARRLSRDPQSRLQIAAYADVAGESGSAARRLSLSRALAVRSRLLEEGVPSARIDVRALGNRTEQRPLDRVDLAVVGP